MRKALALAMIVASFSASAQVYKWVDEDGITHFGNQPPPSQQREEVEIRAPKAGQPAVTRQSSAVERVKQLERERQADRLEQARERRDRLRSESSSESPDYVCQNAKDRLENYKRRWDDIKRQGYTISQQNRWEARIEREEDHVENICR